MGSVLSSFNRSGLGAFRRSGLGARGGGSPQDWLIDISPGTNIWTSLDGATFTSVSAANLLTPYVGGVASIKRIFMATQFLDDPFSASRTAMQLTGIGSFVTNSLSLVCNPVTAGAALIGAISGGTSYMGRSTDNGANWAQIPHATPGTGSPTTFVEWVGLPLKTLTGRILIFGKWNQTIGTAIYPYYSDDDGANWTAGTIITATLNPNVLNGLVYQYSGGTIWFISNVSTNQRVFSSDDGATWSTAASTGTTMTGFARTFALSSGRVYSKIGATAYYSDDDWATRTAAALYGIVLPNGDIYSVDAAVDLLKVSTDGGQSISTVTTSPSPLTNATNNLWRYGAIN